MHDRFKTKGGRPRGRRGGIGQDYGGELKNKAKWEIYYGGVGESTAKRTHGSEIKLYDTGPNRTRGDKQIPEMLYQPKMDLIHPPGDKTINTNPNRQPAKYFSKETKSVELLFHQRTTSLPWTQRQLFGGTVVKSLM